MFPKEPVPPVTRIVLFANVRGLGSRGGGLELVNSGKTDVSKVVFFGIKFDHLRRLSVVSKMETTTLDPTHGLLTRRLRGIIFKGRVF